MLKIETHVLIEKKISIESFEFNLNANEEHN
jgi:hypothetical protein